MVKQLYSSMGSHARSGSYNMTLKICKDLRKLMKKYDFKLEKVGKHYTWHGANGAIIVTSKTPGKARYLKEIECNIRKQLNN